MKSQQLPPDLVPLVSYSVRKDNSTGHGRDYKLLAKAMDDGKLLKITIGRNIHVSKSAADRFLASRVALCKAKDEPESRCGVSMDDRVRALEQTVTDLCVELGFFVRSYIKPARPGPAVRSGLGSSAGGAKRHRHAHHRRPLGSAIPQSSSGKPPSVLDRAPIDAAGVGSETE